LTCICLVLYACAVSDSQNQQGDLWLSLEGVCLGLTHDKVMTSLAEFTRDKEQSLTALCHRLIRPASSSTSPSFGGMYGASGPSLSSASSSSLSSSIEAALNGSSARRGSTLIHGDSPTASSSPSSVWMLFAGSGNSSVGGAGSVSGSSNGNSPRGSGSGSSTPSSSSSASSFLPFAAPPRIDRDSSFSLESLGLRTPLCGLDVSAAIERLIALNAPTRRTPVSRLVVLKVCTHVVNVCRFFSIPVPSP
jgi:hypothetical protein